MTTIRQRRFVKKMLENAGDETSLKKIAKDAGYPDSVAKTPARIIKSQGVTALFEKAGISPENIAKEWNDLNALPVREKTITADNKRKRLESLTKIIIENPEQKIAPQVQFIDKFLNLQMLKQNKPRIHPGKGMGKNH